MHQNTQICKLNFKNFLGAMLPDFHTREGLRRPSPDFTPLGAPASLGAFSPSIAPNQKSWIHPWAHSPSENPGYAYVFSCVNHMDAILSL